MTIERRVVTASELELRQEGDAAPAIVGYAAVFDSLSEDLGGFRERIKSGAFTRSIRDGADVRAFVDHDPSKILGRNVAGTLRLKPNAKGLMVEIDPPDTQAARDIRESIKRGDVSGMSFAFLTRSDEWHMEDGEAIRELLDVDLHDVSVVTYPAYPATDVAVRSLEAFKAAAKAEEQAGRPVGLLRFRLALAERA